MGWIYQITSPSGKKYIGKYEKKNPLSRWLDHQKPTSQCRGVKNAIQKYGAANMIFEPLYEISYKTHGYRWKEFLCFWEKYEIEEEDTLAPKGYNLKSGGKYNTLAQEVRDRIGDAHRGVPKSEEQKAKQSLAMSGSKNPNYGKVTPDDVKEKLRIANNGKKYGRKESQCKKVEQWSKDYKTLLKLWDCITDAANALKISPGDISMVCNNKPSHKSAGTFGWCFGKYG